MLGVIALTPTSGSYDLWFTLVTLAILVSAWHLMRRRR